MKVLVASADFGSNCRKLFNFPQQQTVYEDLNYVVMSFDDFNTDSRKKSLLPRAKGKIPKMMAWLENDADYYIWVDSSFTVKSPLFIDAMLSKLDQSDICLFRHPSRNSIKTELDFVLSGMKQGDSYLLSRYDGERMSAQVEYYLSDRNFTDDNLFALGIFAYSKKLVIDKFSNVMSDWFLHNCYWSVQDQLSLPYLLQKHRVKWATYDFHIFQNGFVDFRPNGI